MFENPGPHGYQTVVNIRTLGISLVGDLVRALDFGSAAVMVARAEERDVLRGRFGAPSSALMYAEATG